MYNILRLGIYTYFFQLSKALILNNCRVRSGHISRHEHVLAAYGLHRLVVIVVMRQRGLYSLRYEHICTSL